MWLIIIIHTKGKTHLSPEKHTFRQTHITLHGNKLTPFRIVKRRFSKYRLKKKIGSKISPKWLFLGISTYKSRASTSQNSRQMKPTHIEIRVSGSVP